MIRYLTLSETLDLYRQVMEQTGGGAGIRDPKALESALTQPRATYGGEDLYPTLVEKAAALCFLLISNHPFVDGNKRLGHAAMEVFLLLNGYEINATIDEQEEIILSIAAGRIERSGFAEWLTEHVGPSGQ
jgi:death-on-curing protein